MFQCNFISHFFFISKLFISRVDSGVYVYIFMHTFAIYYWLQINKSILSNISLLLLEEREGNNVLCIMNYNTGFYIYILIILILLLLIIIIILIININIIIIIIIKNIMYVIHYIRIYFVCSYFRFIMSKFCTD